VRSDNEANINQSLQIYLQGVGENTHSHRAVSALIVRGILATASSADDGAIRKDLHKFT